MNWLFNKRERDKKVLYRRRAMYSIIKEPFHKINRFLDKFFPRFGVGNIDKRYIAGWDEHYYIYTGCKRSVFATVVGKRFVKDYYYALRGIQEKLHNWFIECWNKVYPGIPYDKLEIVEEHKLCIQCEAENRLENAYLSLYLDTDYYITIKNKEWWRVIIGVSRYDDEKREAIGEDLWNIRAYLQK